MPAVEALIGKVVEYCFDFATKGLISENDIDSNIKHSLERHLKYVASWSQNIQKYGWLDIKSISEDTISLDFNLTPRRLLARFQKSKIITEQDFLSGNGTIIILGDPGSGKTTTLRRFCSLFFDESQNNLFDAYQYPIFVKANDVETDVYAAIADCIGLGYQSEKRERTIIAEHHSKRYEFEQSGAFPEYYYIHTYHGRPLRDTLIQFLSETKAYLFIDGLEESDISVRNSLKTDLSYLAMSSGDFGIMTSSRSGDYTSTIDGFTPVEIASLSKEKSNYIIERWCSEPDLFKMEASRTKYADLLNRPLFLNHIIYLFNMQRYLPEQSSDVYRRIVLLSLEKWDQSRKISRRSQYDMLQPERRKSFLAMLAFHLVILSRKSSFTRNEFLLVYAEIHKFFGLPADEGEEVASEIESLTGVIVSDTYDSYAFSHFSLMEYLCAEHILQEPSFENLSKYMRIRSSILAICVSMTTNSNRWLISVLLAANSLTSEPNLWSMQLSEFFARLKSENPILYADHNLGIATLAVLSGPERETRYPYIEDEFDQNNYASLVYEVFSFPEIRDSVLSIFGDSRIHESERSRYGRRMFVLDYEPRYTTIDLSFEFLKDGIFVSDLIIEVLESESPVTVKENDLYSSTDVRTII